MSYQKDDYKNMISSFRFNELQVLLATFSNSKRGRKRDLKDEAMKLLYDEPVGFDYKAYLSKIVSVYREKYNFDMYNSNVVRQDLAQVQQPINYQPLQYPRQQRQIASHVSSPQATSQMQRGIYGNNNIAGYNNMQYNYQPTAPRTAMPVVNPQVIIRLPGQVGYNANINAPHTITSRHVDIVRFKNMPFYEVVDEIFKPSILSGVEKRPLQNYPKGSKEVAYKIPLSLQQINLISLNRDISGSIPQYEYQLLLRIGLLEPGLTESIDFLPLGLQIQISSKPCPLPPNAPNTRPGTVARRTPRPIDCTHLLKLNPCIQNTITLNWIPDGKNYVWGVYLVKKLSSSFLLEKLFSKGARSSEITQNKIINKLVDFDPDLSTTSYRYSLICPLSKMRMEIPAKSIHCAHFQCFDARIFILMNEKKPTWLCPTCSKPCNYDDLQIESYFLDIVTSSRLPDSCTEVELLADGTWRVYDETENNNSMDSVADNKVNPIVYVVLDDSDEGENDANFKVLSEEPTKESDLGTKKKNSGNLKQYFVDLILSDDNESDEQTVKDQQGNESQLVDATQPIATTVDVESETQAQVIVVDSPSPPGTPPGTPPI